MHISCETRYGASPTRTDASVKGWAQMRRGRLVGLVGLRGRRGGGARQQPP